MTDKLTEYTVQPDALDGVATALANVAADLSSADLAYLGQVTYDASAFGEFGMDQAWSSFDGNWSKELHITQRAVTELAQKVSRTSGNYRAAEAKAASSMTPARA
ncbi:type VII secretion target [Kitasatospora sp. NPDC096128]|uniref:type VII secretion target n=1 Tax=Kitasatospora sp. NPDC096128 TaxID=3155547 RepID=UPI00331C64F7